jgi:hypothetical protein
MQGKAGLAAGIALAICASVRAAHADPVALTVRWASPPPSRAPSLEDQLTDKLTELTNQLGAHLAFLSHAAVQLTTDCRHRRAHLALGAGTGERFAFHLTGDLQLDDLTAHVQTRLDLSIAGHALQLALPTVDVSPATFRGERGVSLQLPLLARAF